MEKSVIKTPIISIDGVSLIVFNDRNQLLTVLHDAEKAIEEIAFECSKKRIIKNNLQSTHDTLEEVRNYLNDLGEEEHYKFTTDKISIGNLNHCYKKILEAFDNGLTIENNKAFGIYHFVKRKLEYISEHVSKNNLDFNGYHQAV